MNVIEVGSTIVGVIGAGAIAVFSLLPSGDPVPMPRFKPEVPPTQQILPPKDSPAEQIIRVQRVEQKLEMVEDRVKQFDAKLDRLLTPKEKADAERSGGRPQ